MSTTITEDTPVSAAASALNNMTMDEQTAEREWQAAQHSPC